MPRSPAGILFRQYPPRSLSYIAERLQKEGWFDDAGWEVDQGHQTDQWFPDEKVIVGNDVRYSSKAAWQVSRAKSTGSSLLTVTIRTRMKPSTNPATQALTILKSSSRLPGQNGSLHQPNATRAKRPR